MKFQSATIAERFKFAKPISFDIPTHNMSGAEIPTFEMPTVGKPFPLLKVLGYTSLALAGCWMLYQIFKEPGEKPEQTDESKKTSDSGM